MSNSIDRMRQDDTRLETVRNETGKHQTEVLPAPLDEFPEAEDTESFACTAAETSKTRNLFMCAEVSGQIWGFPLAHLSRVTPPQPLHSLPHTRNILGITCFDGRITPVVDLALLLGSPATEDPASRWLVIFALDNGPVATPVDRVVGVLGFTEEECFRVPRQSSSSRESLGSTVALSGAGKVTLADPALLSALLLQRLVG